MKTTLGCMRAYLSRVMLAGLLGGIALGGATLLEAGLVFAGDTTSPLTSETNATEDPVPNATYDDSQPGADDPKYKEGLVAFKNKDYEKAYTIWIELAEAGNASAQFKMGVGYHNGRYLDKDWNEAVKWYEKAEALGHVLAYFNHARILELGGLVKQDFKAAANLYRLAAERHLPQAQLNLGFMYLVGEGVAQDTNEGLMWLILSRDNGLKNATKTLIDLDKHFDQETQIRANEMVREWRIRHPR